MYIYNIEIRTKIGQYANYIKLIKYVDKKLGILYTL